MLDLILRLTEKTQSLSYCFNSPAQVTFCYGGVLFQECVSWGDVLMKGQLHEIFNPRFFSSINPTWDPDSRPKAVLHVASDALRKLTIFEFQQRQWPRWGRFRGEASGFVNPNAPAKWWCETGRKRFSNKLHWNPDLASLNKLHRITGRTQHCCITTLSLSCVLSYFSKNHNIKIPESQH
jgi:hypothetical protein